MLSGDSNQAALLKDKRIRIITISEIRYEGRLYQINSKEKTIALKDVVTYGTEDRRTDTVVPPQQTVYEMIIFKASHIKDLNVLTQEEENKVQVVKKEEEVSAKLPEKNVETKAPQEDKHPTQSQNRDQEEPYRRSDERDNNHRQGGRDYQKSGYGYQTKEHDRNYGGYNNYRRSGDRDHRDHYDSRDNRDNYYQKSSNTSNYRAKGEPSKPFDFDEMVQKNNLLEKEKESKETKEETAKYVHDDFFDTVSTSVNDKGDSKDPYNQYKTNNDTFGYSKRHQGRGGYGNNNSHGHRGGYNGQNRNNNYRGGNHGYSGNGYSGGHRSGGGQRGGRNNYYDDDTTYYEKKNKD